ncbi:hypothetical protein BN871_BM_00350 [Paenibacillus sp. P22]|nr:hypothetical protein BN871_BM_00350 [Paenibacillus sp. P22]
MTVQNSFMFFTYRFYKDFVQSRFHDLKAGDVALLHRMTQYRAPGSLVRDTQLVGMLMPLDAENAWQLLQSGDLSVRCQHDSLLRKTVLDLLEAALEHLVRSMQNRNVAAKLLDMLHPMRREQNRCSLIAELLDGRLQQLHVDRIESAERFVQNHQLRPMDDRRDELDLLLVALGQLFHALVIILRHSEAFQPRLEAFVGVRRRHSLQPGKVDQLLADLDLRIEASLLRQVADVPELLLRVRLAVVQNPALVGKDQPEHHPHRRRFARAVGAEQAVDFSAVHLQADAVDGGFVCILLDDSFHNERFHFLFPPVRLEMLSRRLPFSASPAI